MLTRLCLVRHGETDWNFTGRLQGWTDIPLNDLGMRQAQVTAAHLAGRHFDAIYSSDLSRARMTADAIALSLQGVVQSEPRLRERHLGLMQGLAPADADATYPVPYRRLQSRRPDYAPPDGELVEIFARRVGGMLNEIRVRHAGQTVLAVAHGGVLDMMYRLATALPFDAERTWKLGNCALNWLRHDGTDWTVESWDEKAHLSGARDERAA